MDDDIKEKVTKVIRDPEKLWQQQGMDHLSTAVLNLGCWCPPTRQEHPGPDEV